MPVSTGVAANFVDLLDRFRQFITGDAMGTQRWAQMGWDLQADGNGRDLYIRGPGAAGGEQIFVQLKTIRLQTQDIFNIQINGATGHNPAAQPKYENQPGFDGGVLNMLLWDQAMTYWFVANGRRFVIVAKVSTTYQAAYGGFILPYGLPSEYPYPMAIGAMYEGPARWSVSNFQSYGFTNPVRTLRLRMPSGNWLPFENRYTYQDAPKLDQNVWPNANFQDPAPSPNGTYTLNSLVLHSNTSGDGAARGVFGELQGLARIPGFGNAAENTQLVDGVTWVVFQDGGRTANGNYFALALE